MAHVPMRADSRQIVEDALDFLYGLAPDRGADIRRIRYLVQNSRPMIYRRFVNLVDAATDGERHNLEQDERTAIGRAAQVLQEWDDAYAENRPGPKPSNYVTRVPLQLDERDMNHLAAYCKEHRVSYSEALRRGLRLLTVKPEFLNSDDGD